VLQFDLIADDVHIVPFQPGQLLGNVQSVPTGRIDVAAGDDTGKRH
jgi:hypothetical protein